MAVSQEMLPRLAKVRSCMGSSCNLARISVPQRDRRCETVKAGLRDYSESADDMHKLVLLSLDFDRVAFGRALEG